jgi:hypothetical protein
MTSFDKGYEGLVMSVRTRVLLTIIAATFLIVISFAVFMQLFQGALLIITTIEMALGAIIAIMASDIICRLIEGESESQDAEEDETRNPFSSREKLLERSLRIPERQDDGKAFDVSDNADAATGGADDDDYFAFPVELYKKYANSQVLAAEKNSCGEFIPGTQDIEELSALIWDTHENDETVPAYAETRISITDMSVDGIDIIRALERYQGDEETLCEVLASYALMLRHEVEKLEFRNSLVGEYTQTSDEQPLGQVYSFGFDMRFDFNSYLSSAHTIKSASFGVCANTLGEAAEGLEYAAKDRNIAYIIEHNTTFVMKALVMAERLRSIVAAVNYGKEKPKRAKCDEKTLVRLMDACVRSDLESADLAMKELECYEYTEDSAKVSVIWLRERLDVSDFDGITKRLTAA